MRLALLQTYPVTGVDQGFEALDRWAAEAKARDADVLITPEMFMSGYAIGAEAVREAADAIDPAALSEIAWKHGVALVVGLPERDGEHIYNAAWLIDAEGKIRLRYHKTHLFGDVDRAQFSAGQTLSEVVELGGFRVSLGICYDIEFPELARDAAVKGAEAILVPTANMEPFTSVPMRLVPARAEENAVYVAYANYIGPEAQFVYCGLSCLSGPNGEDVARAALEECLLIGEISHDAIVETRRVLTHLPDRRTDLY